jgi:diadenylate cyclase
MELIREFIAFYWKAGFEILLLAAVIYYFLLLFRGTRGAAVLTGFVIVLLGIVGLTQLFHLDVINWILSRVLALLAIAVLVIFQPELRRGLAQLGSRNPFSSPRLRIELADVVSETAKALAQKRCGALMAIEREIGFRGIAETGIAVDAKATTELLTTIFFENTPLHDGGVILRGDRIASAACIFPLTQQQGLSTQLGMRHRAAIGLSEETDALVVVVSEETGDISVADGGKLQRGLDSDALRELLSKTLASPVERGWGVTDAMRRFVSGLFMREPRNAPAETFSVATEDKTIPEERGEGES